MSVSKYKINDRVKITDQASAFFMHLIGLTGKVESVESSFTGDRNLYRVIFKNAAGFSYPFMLFEDELEAA